MGKNRILKTPTYLSVFVCCFISGAFAQAATFTVNSPFDAADANPGDGVCETAPGNGVCTLRAAIEEANALAGNDTISLPPNTYLLTLANELTITGDLTITGGEASTTIIDGNKSVRPASGVLVVISGITVSISGVTIRDGGRGTITSNADGGGIFNSGTLTLTNSTVPQALPRRCAMESGRSRFQTRLERKPSSASRQLGLQVHSMAERTLNAFEGAFEEATRTGSGAVVQIGHVFFYANQKRIVELAIKHRLPAIYGRREFVEYWWPYVVWVGSCVFRRLAYFVDRILEALSLATCL